MLPYIHLIIGLIVSGGLYFVFPEIGLLKAGIVLASSVLIDFDHYLYYLFETRDFCLRRAYEYFSEKKKIYKELSREKRKNLSTHLLVFHGFEWVLVFSILGIFVWNYLFYIAAGMLLHLIIDLIETLAYPDGFEKISVIHDLIKYKRQNKDIE